jgi:2,3-bisphosphoglycerate-independent phosphoglycerate mutase
LRFLGVKVWRAKEQAAWDLRPQWTGEAVVPIFGPAIAKAIHSFESVTRMNELSPASRLNSTRPRPAVLCVLDGWGYRPNGPDNAIAAARHPNFERMMRECPHALLATSGRAVGLPDGQMGNSEVGHTNIGAGRLVMQDLVRVDDAVKDGTIAECPALKALIAAARQAKGAVHLMGLLSPGGVHSHQDHMVALARIASDAGLRVHVHAFLDGRDTPPQSADGFVAGFEAAISGLRNVTIATVSGRYYAMDRDKRWERVAKAYAIIVDADGPRFADARTAIEDSYRNGCNDEFVIPCAIGGYAGAKDGDALLFANFRPDRAREISNALLDPGFDGFPRARVPKFSAAAGMTEYSKPLSQLMAALFAPQDVSETIGEIFAQRGLKQLRIAETEKYPHVTFFMNGGREAQFDGEDRIMVPSPKIATYDLKPEMSAYEVTDKLIEAIAGGKYDLIIVNYANPDMVGHTGIMDAAIHAVEAVDICLGRLREAVEKSGGVLIVTADHGNVEQMKDPVTGEPHTAHTLLDVPFIVVNAKAAGGPLHLHNGRLADVAPTLLDLVGFPKPPQMTGKSLVGQFAHSGTPR